MPLIRYSQLKVFLLGTTVLPVLLVPASIRAETIGTQLVAAAMERTQHSVRYDGSYHSIPYPMGDVPKDIGVCTDVVIRSFRTIGFDLQKAVHEDMSAHFDAYPSHRIWGLTRPDSNIDHRRVPNLQTYFERFGESLPLSEEPDVFMPGDIVTWVLPGNLPHIGIVTDRLSAGGGVPMIIHNIGAGPKLENMLFRYPITGQYRFLPAPALTGAH